MEEGCLLEYRCQLQKSFISKNQIIRAFRNATLTGILWASVWVVCAGYWILVFSDDRVLLGIAKCELFIEVCAAAILASLLINSSLITFLILPLFRRTNPILNRIGREWHWYLKQQSTIRNRMLVSDHI